MPNDQKHDQDSRSKFNKEAAASLQRHNDFNKEAADSLQRHNDDLKGNQEVACDAVEDLKKRKKFRNRQR